MSVLNRARSSYLVILAFSLLLCCGLAVTGLRWAQDRSDQWVAHTVQVRARLAQARILGLRAEVARRGFLLTGNAQDLTGTRAARAEAGAELDALTTMTADNPQQQHNLSALRRALAHRFAEMDYTLTLVLEGQAELIADSGRAMMRLLNDILDLSKVEAGQMRIASEAFDLPHALNACVRLVTPAIEQKGLSLRVDISDALPRTILGDGLRLRQIILKR